MARATVDFSLEHREHSLPGGDSPQQESSQCAYAVPEKDVPMGRLMRRCEGLMSTGYEAYINDEVLTCARIKNAKPGRDVFMGRLVRACEGLVCAQ
jgi:hypothetical protein